jgi:hypothetical protein
LEVPPPQSGAAVGTTSPVFAHTDKYWIGYSQGQTQARTDYYAYANDYRPFCPEYDDWTAANGPHSSNFCAGFVDGYNAAWYNLVVVWHNASVQQSTSQSVRINGDNNKVVQTTINNVGSSGSGYGHSSGINPRCANIQVR